MDKCTHPEVRIYRRLVAAETRYLPAEWQTWGVCQKCGQSLDYDDIPNDSEKIDD